MDMIVNLYALRKPANILPEGIRIARAIPFEAGEVAAFVRASFPEGQWADEIQGALMGPLPRVYVAIADHRIVGFAAYDATAKGFFGPFGVKGDMRKKGIGEALAYQTFLAMREDGYAYAIIGWAGPKEWYEKTFNAVGLNNSLEESVYSRSDKR
jgi:hypothetical protein